MTESVQTQRDDWPDPLLQWYASNKRDMPWRAAGGPYNVWVSEIMLQQTQVDTAIPYYRRFIHAFPGVKSLAAAPLEDVLKQWEGLGYYARARNMHRAARQLVAAGEVDLPRSHAALLALPGIGEYTAAAIASICFGDAVPAIDGNAVRVFARFLGIREDSTGNGVRKAIANYAADHIPAAYAGDFTQAVMELGALVCRPSRPDCSLCPLVPWCRAYSEDMVDTIPVRPRKPAVPQFDIAVAVVVHGGQVLIVRRPDDGMLGGMWEFPGGRRKGKPGLRQTACSSVRRETGLDVRLGKRLCVVKHAYSHFNITLYAYAGSVLPGQGRGKLKERSRWAAVASLDEYPFSTVSRKVMGHVFNAGAG